MPKVTEQKAVSKSTNKKGGGVLDRISSIQDLPDEGIKICFYGESGSGKTTLLSTFPKPMLIAICSRVGETRTVKKTKGIDAVVLDDEEELAELVAMQRETRKYATFAVDHITGFQDLVLKKVIKANDVPTQLAWGTATQSEWGDVGIGVKERLRDVLSLPCNVVLVAQERAFNTEANVSEVLKPYVNCALSPSIAGWIGPSCEYLCQCFLRMGKKEVKVKIGNKEAIQQKETGKVEFCLRTSPNPVFKTNFRVCKGVKTPESISDPTYEKIMKLING